MDLIFYFLGKRSKIKKHVNVLDNLDKIIREIILSNQELSDVEIDYCCFKDVKLDMDELIINLSLNDDDTITINSKSDGGYQNYYNDDQRNNYFEEDSQNNSKKCNYLTYLKTISAANVNKPIQLIPVFDDKNIDYVYKMIDFISINGEKLDEHPREYTFTTPGTYKIYVKFIGKLNSIPMTLNGCFKNFEFGCK